MTENFNAGQHYAHHADVSDLQHHWGSAYRISYRAGQFRAERRDGGESVLTASTSREMRELIAADYAARPVPR